MVIVDPPWAGLSRGVAEALKRLGPERILYVSCDPATLARDVGKLAASGKGPGEEDEAGAVYGVREVQPVDMFPWTSGVECVVLMVREGCDAGGKAEIWDVSVGIIEYWKERNITEHEH